MTDEQLAEQCRARDEAAFQELMKRYMKQIFHFARQYTHTTEDAEDVVQDTFFKVWKYIKKYTKGRAFKPWLFTIARNTALDFLKKKRPALFSEMDSGETDVQYAETLEDPEPLAPEIFHNAALAIQIGEAMDTLHPDHRAVLVMHYQENMTFEDIAITVDKPMNTVKSWHRRSLIRLKKLLAPKSSIKS